MAPPLDTEAQFKFLICCIKHTNAGKVDFGEVANELEIVSKGAAAKRYERLMKAHGIAGNGNGGGKAGGSPAPSGPSNPATPKTPASARKTAPTSNKKRKLAARGNDVDDDDDIKPEIKDEVKQENQQESDGSYTINPSGPPPQASAAAMPVNVSGDAYGENEGESDEVLLISEVRRGNGGPAAPLAFASQQQMLTPPPQESFYGFVGPAAQLHRPSQQAIAVTSMPMRYEHDANYPPPQTIPLVPAEMGGHWLHHPDPAFFWGDVTRLETSPGHVDHHARGTFQGGPDSHDCSCGFETGHD